MKKYSILALALIMAASVLAGCRRRDERPADTVAPTVMPTVTQPAAVPTEHTTVPTTEATIHTSEPIHESTNETLHENGTTGDHATEDTNGAASRSRHIPGGR